MKRMSKLLLMALIMVTVSMVTFAQNAEQKNKRNLERKPGAQKERITPEQFAERQARSIASTLAFDDATTTRFVETFCNYRKELIALKGKDKKQPKAEAAPQAQGEKPEARKPRMEKKERTEAETKEMLEGRFEMNQKMLDLRKKYYHDHPDVRGFYYCMPYTIYEAHREEVKSICKEKGAGLYIVDRHGGLELLIKPKERKDVPPLDIYEKLEYLKLFAKKWI